MSELKTYNSGRIYWAVEQVERVAGDIDTLHLDDSQFYLKTEADKVIAELKKERDWLAKDRALAYDDLEKRAQLNIEQEESIRHQKYKRCLAMARWCRSRACFYDTMREDGLYWGVKSDRAYKWYKRWLKIADQFEETR